jgi:kinesin family protein 14
MKRSAVLVPNVSDGVQRSSLSFQHPLESANKTDPKSIAVNVNVAVGVDCDEKSLKAPNSNTNTINTNINDNRMTEDLQNNNNDYFDAIDYLEGISSSLKVAVRLRPFLQSEIDSGNDIMAIDMKGNTVRIFNSDNENYNKLEFGFDMCLNSSDRDLFDYADQDTVYRKMGEPLLDRSLEGYNVCLFAYGQTGSGKSYTMMGSEAIPGIIPRFVNELYKKIISLNDIIINVEVSYLEIYNEKIYDLLSDHKNYNKKILRVREHPQTGPYVEDLTIHVVNTYEEIMDFLFSGKRRRATASTAANDESSRSHSIFTIFLSQLKKSDEYLMDKSSSCTSKINLVDLAGSERVGICGTSGERLKEGTLINKSLLTLGKVISQLAENGINNKSVYVPYRDSVLTWLLKESLGGNSRTSMIATISPAKCNLEETLSTLRYAAIARRIVNFVRINEDPKAKKIRELMEEIAILKKQQISNANKLKTNFLNKDQMTETCCEKIQTFSKTTSTSFILRENQTQFDLLRTNILEEQQRSLLNEMRKQKQYSNIPDNIPEKSKSELLKQIHDLFEDVLNKNTFESEETVDESTLIANTSDSSNALQNEESEWN